jgi:hypothetical protein
MLKTIFNWVWQTWLLLLISNTEVYANNMEKLIYLVSFIIVMLLLPLPYLLVARPVRLFNIILYIISLRTLFTGPFMGPLFPFLAAIGWLIFFIIKSITYIRSYLTKG